MPSPIVLPTWDAASIALHAAIGAMALLTPALERGGLLRLDYSKFRTGTGIDGRVGMFVLYFLPLVVIALGVQRWYPAGSAVQMLCAGAIALHFVKRCIEVLFVHRYGGPIDVATTATVAMSYSATAGLAIWLDRHPVGELDGVFAFGSALFVVGELGNLYHHVLLAKLRERSSGYFIPRGGLFEQVACPHYLFELVAWLGMAVMWRHFAMYLVFAGMVSYLAGRARKNDAWYRARFPDYPASRKALVPGLF